MVVSATSLHRREDVKWWEVDGEAVLYDPASGTGHVLNQTAFDIWQACDGNRSRDDIERDLIVAHPESADAIRSDMTELVSQLLVLDLVSESPSV